VPNFLRESEIKPGVKRILISAFEMNDELFHNCHSIDTFLLIPVTMSELIHVVQQYVSKVEIKQNSR